MSWLKRRRRRRQKREMATQVLTARALIVEVLGLALRVEAMTCLLAAVDALDEALARLAPEDTPPPLVRLPAGLTEGSSR
jgi:hypothetical protein